MEYEELKEINFGKPTKELLEKALMECDGKIAYYRKCSKEDNKRYYKGILSWEMKQRKLITDKLDKFKMNKMQVWFGKYYFGLPVTMVLIYFLIRCFF